MPPPLPCPACQSQMEQVDESEFRYEHCPSCDGVFLDPGELNALATGMAGDIEFCSLSGDAVGDARRTCPKCEDQAMEERALLSHLELAFDHCPGCGGWFLERGQLADMNRELRDLGTGEPEYRGSHRGRKVLMEVVPGFEPGAVGPMGIADPQMVEWYRVVAYLPHTLGAGLRVSPQSWLDRIVELFGAQDVATGDHAFDAAFRVRAKNPAVAKRVLTSEVRTEMLAFVKSPSSELGRRQTFELVDDRVVFWFTTWNRDDLRPTEEQKARLYEDLGKIAYAFT